MKTLFVEGITDNLVKHIVSVPDGGQINGEPTYEVIALFNSDRQLIWLRDGYTEEQARELLSKE